MYQKESYIYLSETDATGVIFHPKLLEKCLYVYENFLIDKGKNLKEFFGQKYYFPVVNVVLDFMQPLNISDKVVIQLSVVKMGETSLTLQYMLYNDKETLCARALITHVLVDQKTLVKTPLPQDLKDFYIHNLS